MKISKKTKGETLIYLKNKKFNVPKLLIIDVFSFQKEEEKIIKKIKQKFNKDKIIIRSSSFSEDGLKKSNAGKFLSIPNIYSYQTQKLKSSIKKVIRSYNSKQNNQVIIQKMVENVKLSGVCTTVDLHNYLPITVINYSTGNNTEIVTSGKEITSSLNITDKKYLKKTNKFYKFYTVVENLINFLKFNLLDIEFAIDKKNNVHLLQVRPIVIPRNKKIVSKKFYFDNLYRLKKKIIKLQEKNYDLLGSTNYFGVMADWNPAEIIGTKPKQLALSTYKELITDHVWSSNRYNYGFRNINKHHLMTTFFGTPYVDIRVDFNSWIPKNLDHSIAKKLMEVYLKRFSKNKSYHDKVEFKILYTCLTLSTDKRLTKELKNNFSPKELKKLKTSLVEINQKAYDISKEDLKKIELLKKNIIKISNSKIHEINKIYYLVEECKDNGTLAFAGLARCGFIAIDILNSFVESKIITTDQKNNFLNSIENIATDVNENYILLNKKNFIEKYGHLRPNTYDITSLNYKEGYHIYFNKKSNFEKKNIIFKFSNEQKKKIKKYLITKNLQISFKDLVKFIRSSIYYREYSKFIFTRCIDEIFKNLILIGKKYDIKRDDLAFLNIQQILELHDQLDPMNVFKNIKKQINQNKVSYKKNLQMQLPEIITSWKDIYVYEKNLNIGNFITQKKIHNKIYELKKLTQLNNIKNKIVLIESADPGYDFIFSKKIGGLITKFGGQNSHMSIRCSELSIPAAIGIGEKRFELLKQKNSITLDCQNKKIY